LSELSQIQYEWASLSAFEALLKEIKLGKNYLAGYSTLINRIIQY